MVSLLLLACVFCSCGVAAAGPALEDGWASKILEGVKLDTLKIGAPPASSALSNLAASITAGATSSTDESLANYNIQPAPKLPDTRELTAYILVLVLMAGAAGAAVGRRVGRKLVNKNRT